MGHALSVTISNVVHSHAVDVDLLATEGSVQLKELTKQGRCIQGLLRVP